MYANKTKEEQVQLENRINIYTMYSLIDRASKKMRGVTANIVAQDLTITIFFDNELTEEEREEMECAHTEIISDLYQEFVGMYLNLSVVPSSTSIYDQKGNLGWFYLRKEY
ncbi:hypothetical protein A9G42_03215 [Gilliamella sp. Nev6-6]|jgi:hypothetical protein|uniref:hypothetical protein n=1 Tax=Gilliamella sp. Nev6-6 TaxID=3120252 RepID=UPI00080F58F8|nr:hypothetical protein [Gilliamella apicola]OCG78437.1 hypothetical protein A9G42_03215 [Gilliamella apicola]